MFFLFIYFKLPLKRYVTCRENKTGAGFLKRPFGKRFQRKSHEGTTATREDLWAQTSLTFFFFLFVPRQQRALWERTALQIEGRERELFRSLMLRASVPLRDDSEKEMKEGSNLKKKQYLYSLSRLGEAPLHTTTQRHDPSYDTNRLCHKQTRHRGYNTSPPATMRNHSDVTLRGHAGPVTTLTTSITE